MEYFATDYRVISQFARHYETGQVQLAPQNKDPHSSVIAEAFCPICHMTTFLHFLFVYDGIEES